jgi:hypothetical protein
VPLVAYAEAPFAGSKTPRQWAKTARKRTREASSALDSGAVRRWYRENGWTYPIQGPSAHGLAGLQQFFEALGLTKPPRVHVSETLVHLRGTPGACLTHEIVLETDEPRIVYGWGQSSASWLMPGPVRDQGDHAVLPFDVVVPDGAEALDARLTIRVNGNRQFVIEVRVEVEAGDPMIGLEPAKSTVAPLPDFLREAMPQEAAPVAQPMAIPIAWPIDGPDSDPAT